MQRSGLLLRNWRALEKVFVGGDGSVEEEGQPALLQLLSHLPSISDDNTAFLLASGRRARVSLLPKPVSGPLCTNFYIASFKNPQILGGFDLHLVMLLFLLNIVKHFCYLKKSCVNSKYCRFFRALLCNVLHILLL